MDKVPKYLKTEQNFFHAGNPIRKHIMTSLSRDEAKKAFHLTNANKVILAIGGSQGALKINELISLLLMRTPNGNTASSCIVGTI